MSKFAVTLNYHGNYGYVEYDSEFLNEKLTLDVQEGDTVRQFVTKTLDPLENLDNFKICLTRLWFNTDVLVEWSMPPGMTENL